MKPLAIAVAGIIGVVFVFVLDAYIPLVLVVLHCLTLCCILVGTLIPATSRHGKLTLYPKEEGAACSDESAWPCLEGRALNPGVQHSIEFHLEFIRAWFLALVGMLSLLAIASVLLVNKDVFSPANIDSGVYILLLVVAFGSFAPFAIAGAWLVERRLLARSPIAMGRVISEGGSYTFMNAQGEWHGGTRRRGSRNIQDTLCVVFYSEANAQVNVSSSGLRFHRLIIC
jgi:hypothetical protein